MMKWNAARIDQLINLWGSGLSTSRIAKAMGGGITKGMVLGKASRLGLPSRAPRETSPDVINARKEKHRKQMRDRKGSVKRVEAPASSGIPPRIEPLNLTFAQIEQFQCRWIDNDDTSAPLYCGHPVHGNTSWCACHLHVVQHGSKPEPTQAHKSPFQKSRFGAFAPVIRRAGLEDAA